MFDYLNEILLWTGRTNRRDGTYKQAMRLKRQGDTFIFNLLCKEWISRFKWTSDNPSIATELIEQTILLRGAVAFAKIAQGNGNYFEESWRCCMPSGWNNLSFYGYPTQTTLTDYKGKVLGTFIPALWEDDTNIANCALIYDNTMRFSPIRIILHYAERLSLINSSINAIIPNITGTSLIVCDREQAKSIESQRQKALVGVPFIVQYEGYGTTNKPELLVAPEASTVMKVLYEAFDKTHADYLQAIGVKSNNNIDKKSGVTPLEILQSRQNVDLILNNALEIRQRGIELCERIGLTGLKVDLDDFESNTGDYLKTGEKVNGIERINSDTSGNINPNLI